MSDARAVVVLRVIAVLGLVTAVVVTVIGWRFLTDLDARLDESLAIGEDAAATLSETIDVAEDVVVAVDDGLEALLVTFETLDDTLGSTTDLAATTASLAATLPDSFREIDVALATVESIGGTIDSALRTASRIPLGPDYEPDVPFPDAVAELRTAFGPIGDDLRAISVELDEFATGSGDLASGLAGVRASVAETRTALSDNAALLDDYRDAADRAGAVASRSRDDLGRSVVWARVSIVMLALTIASLQFVPWWLAARLRSGRDFTEAKPLS